MMVAEGRVQGGMGLAADRSVRVMLVDDHPVVCMGLRAGLEHFPDIAVECEAQDGASALKLATRHNIDVAIIDIRLPDLDGLDVAARLQKILPGARVILISGDFPLSTLERGIEIRVNGFFLKTESPQNLAELIRRVSSGEYCCSSGLKAQLEPGSDGFELVLADRPRLGALSAREREMLITLANGASLKQASLDMEITYKSADYLKQSLMRKLRIHDRVELARFAVREGLMS